MVGWLFAVIDTFISVLSLKITHVLHIRRYRILNVEERIKEAMEALVRQSQRACIDRDEGRYLSKASRRLLKRLWADNGPSFSMKG